MKSLGTIFCIFFVLIAIAGNFTPGNIVVVRVGSGSATLTSSAHPVFIDEYSPTGVLVQSIALPTSQNGTNHPFTLSGIATSEGAISLSANGQYLITAGYDAPPGTPTISSDSTLNRVVARIAADGTVNTSTGILAGTAYRANNIRGATSNDGTSFWTAGDGEFDSGGTYYFPFGSFTSFPIKISDAPNNSRTIQIFGNQLFISSKTNAFNGISTVGSGVPATGGQTTTLLPGFYSPSGFSIYDFCFFDADESVPGLDLLYFCDDRDVPPSGGLYKYSLVNGIWTSNGNVSVAHALKGLVAQRGCVTQIYCVSGSRVYSLTDVNGYNQPITGTLTEIGFAPANTKFRRLAFAPGTIPATCPVSISGVIKTALGDGIPEVNVSISGSESQTTITDTNGFYGFTVAKGGDYTVLPSLDTDSPPANGITTLDLVLMKSHVLGMHLLDSPYKIIAADDNVSSTVTTLDIVLGRAIILGNTSGFPGGKLWQFVDSDFIFPDVQNPYSFPTSRSYSNLGQSSANQDFIGIKLGDVNDSWSGGH